MTNPQPDPIHEILALPRFWHDSGALPRAALEAIIRHAEPMGPIQRSAETGCGKSTLLFSHLSRQHVVFTLAGDGTLAKVKDSRLLNRKNVTFVEGPTQRTLPRYDFVERVQIALIDGPHGYPYPDLEYYYFFPVIQEGGLLLIDDIKIPSICRMFEIIKADDMFELQETIYNNLAIFKRTSAPCQDPEGDGWVFQGFNRAYYDMNYGRPRMRSLGPVQAWIWRMIPSPLKKLIPGKTRKAIRIRF
jgi:hypothetical protein